MNIEKRNRYINNLYAALHTLSGRLAYANLDATNNDCVIKTCTPKHTKTQDYYYIQLNPNKAVGEQTMIKTFSQFTRVLDDVMDRIEAEQLQITRADLSFNSDDPIDYDLFKKLNKLLICCLAEKYKIRNAYHTSNLWTDRSLSIAAKSDMIEAENYNKFEESDGATEAKNRLELRSKRMSVSIEEEFKVKWFDRLDKAVTQFEAVQDHYNREMVKAWTEDKAKPKKEQNYLSWQAFVLRYRDNFFTRKQLQSFLVKIGVENPEIKAKKFKERHTIEFFSLTDLKLIIKAIKDATLKYFNN